jgi:hypothetical protein
MQQQEYEKIDFEIEHPNHVRNDVFLPILVRKLSRKTKIIVQKVIKK